jgi:MFS transporter, FSR family, fosmidomycin resistance protein
MSAPTAQTTPPPDSPDTVPLKQDAAVMGLVGLAHATSHFTHLLLPPLFPVFMSEFALSYSDVGLLMTVFFVISGIGQASAGFLVDRVGARPVLFGSIGLFMVSALVASAADGYGMLVLAAALAGLGNASFHPVDFSILNQRVSAARLGHAFSVHGLTGNLGWAITPVFLATLTALFDWRTAYQAAALLYVVVLAVLFWQRDKLHTEAVVRSSTAPPGADLAFLKLPVVWWCFTFFLLSTMTLAVIQTYSTSILQTVHGVSFEAATFTLTAYMLCGALGMVVGGFVAGRARQSDRVVGYSMGAGALLLLVCATGALNGTLTMVLISLTGFAVGVAGPSRDMMIKRATPKGATGRVYGTVYSGLDVGFAISPVLFGAFMDRGWYGTTLAGAGLVLLLAVFAAVNVGRRVGPNPLKAAAQA